MTTNISKNLLICCFVLVSLFSILHNAYAHPGRTASDGCHYCRTNCNSWGVVWDQRHCHNTPTPTTLNHTPKQETSKSTYTAQIQDKANESYDWIYWVLGIVLVGGIGFWVRKK